MSANTEPRVAARDWLEDAGARFGPRQRVHVGIALRPHSMVAVVPHRRGMRRYLRSGPARSLDPPDGDGSWASLSEALRELREVLDSGRLRLSVALQRPLCQVKTLVLPRLRTAELRRMIERNPARFMALPAAPAVADICRVPARPWHPRRALFLVAAADARIVDSVLRAAEEAGFIEPTITAGPVSAAAGACALAPRLRRGRYGIVTPTAEAIEILCLDRGRLRLSRSVPVGLPVAGADGGVAPRPPSECADPEADSPLHAQSRRLLVETAALDPPPLDRVATPVAVLAAALGPEVPAEVPKPVEHVPALGHVPWEAVAAFGSTNLPDTAIRLRPEPWRRAEQRRQRFRTAALLGIAAAILTGAAGLHLWDLRRELAAIEQRRAALRPAVEEIVRARTMLRGVDARLTSLRAQDERRTHWPALFALLSDVLPIDAHLVGLLADSAHLRLDVRARSAARVIAAFEAAPGADDVGVAAPVRREDTPGGGYERLVLLVARSSLSSAAASRPGRRSEHRASVEPRAPAGPSTEAMDDPRQPYWPRGAP